MFCYENKTIVCSAVPVKGTNVKTFKKYFMDTFKMLRECYLTEYVIPNRQSIHRYRLTVELANSSCTLTVELFSALAVTMATTLLHYGYHTITLYIMVVIKFDSSQVFKVRGFLFVLNIKQFPKDDSMLSTK